jgi:hypothetical protein
MNGCSRSQNVGYIASKLKDSPDSWNVYNRLVVCFHSGGYICKWNCRYDALGGDPWAFFQVNADGTVTLGKNPIDGSGNNIMTITPYPGILAKMQG